MKYVRDRELALSDIGHSIYQPNFEIPWLHLYVGVSVLGFFYQTEKTVNLSLQCLPVDIAMVRLGDFPSSTEIPAYLKAKGFILTPES